MFKFMQMFGSRVPAGFSPEKVDVKALLKRLHEDEEGQGMTEYIIILVLIAVFVILVVKFFGQKIKDLFGQSTQALNKQVVVEGT